ncbi:phosphotransferase enzyme family protein [Halalkalibacter akibai]|uniref:Homoserine kinase n=1 Tax=Halalkalibacter akibai (strain ATCC 43226 / DSM 21942 / CIP 109018 / JCM 9157 / 1139) TaxID=1236973 RepID=W4QYX3_HALA3|nr:phosphotransferase [Halalkalibacter akibai]GAE37276.1 homoserine kinase [Halalkalibacter akibai JCM 9157]
MERSVEECFTPDILLEALKPFSLKENSLKKLGSFENYVYEATLDGREVILRLTHSSHRTKAEIESELDWILYLHKNGAPVCPPLLSSNKQYVEEIKAKQSSFFVSLFTKANGYSVKQTNIITNQHLIKKWGQTTGMLHRLTKEYRVPTHMISRKDLLDEFEFQFAPYIPNDPFVIERIKEVLTEVKALSKNETNYGLIHTDLHSGNFHYTGSSLEIFDFDDCAYHFFTHDIAIPIYYTFWQCTDKDQNIMKSHSEEFLRQFLSGYLLESSIEPLENLSLFLRLRDCELYGVLHKKLELPLNTKQFELISTIRNRIIAREAIVDLEFSDL